MDKLPEHKPSLQIISDNVKLQKNTLDKLPEPSTVKKVIDTTGRGLVAAFSYVGKAIYNNTVSYLTSSSSVEKCTEKVNITGTKTLETKEPVTAEKFAENVLKSLEKHQGIIDVNGSLCWISPNGKPIFTGQKTEKLKNALINQFKIAEDSSSLIQVRLKFGTKENRTGFKHEFDGGETRFAIFDPQGNLKEIAKKTKVLGEGAFGKAKKISTPEGDKTIKSTFIPKEAKNLEENQPLFNLHGHLEKSEKDILNEKKKIHYVTDGKVLRGIQHPPEHTFITIPGERKGVGLETKLGFQGVLYSGDTNLLDIDGEFDDDNDWTVSWKPHELNKGLADLTEGLQTCHQKELYLGDIKTANIFRDDAKKELRLADFGGSQTKDEIWNSTENKSSSYTSTPSFACFNDLIKMNEIDNIDDLAELRSKADVYGLGVSMYEILAKNKMDYLPGTDNLAGMIVRIMIEQREVKFMKNLPKAESDLERDIRSPREKALMSMIARYEDNPEKQLIIFSRLKEKMVHNLPETDDMSTILSKRITAAKGENSIDEQNETDPRTDDLAALIAKMTHPDYKQRISSEEANKEMQAIEKKYKPTGFWSYFSKN